MYVSVDISRERMLSDSLMCSSKTSMTSMWNIMHCFIISYYQRKIDLIKEID